MARPAKSLLRRCQERSFRARHHAPLLARAPDLPHPVLSELQQRARAAITEDELDAIAREFARTLRSLPALELPPAEPEPAPIAGGPGERPRTPPSARQARNEAFVAAVEAALEQLPGHHGSQLTASEQIQAELIRRAAERLAEIDQRLAEDGLTVAGSRRQLRQHPLLALEAGLRRDLTQSLRQLESTARSRTRLERLNALTRSDPAAAHARHRKQP